MRGIWHFLGSIWLAVPLITLFALLVVVGTLIESKTSSHEMAASWIYSHPLFNLLLALFFVNILVSALRRFPWKRGHIPFLMTHLGLLMVILGTVIKNLYGIQGHMIIAEGSGSHKLFLTGTKSLVLQEEDPKEPLNLISHSYPLDRTLPSGFRAASFHLKGYVPYATSSLGGFIQDEGVQLFHFPLIPKTTLENFQSFQWPFDGTLWNLACIKTEEIDTCLEMLKGKKNSLFFLQCQNHDLLLAIDDKATAHIREFPKIPQAYNAYSRGFGGYSLEIELPFITLESPLRQKIEVADKMAEASPAILVEFDGGEKVALAYDSTGIGIKWPVLSGRYLAAFQPIELDINTHVRLKKATKELYPGTVNPKAYEASILVTDRATSKTEPFTLKMNQVYETDEGWRFYLSNLLEEPGERKMIQLVVNYDPVRYRLTYPGAFLLSLGAALILFRKRKLS